MGYDQTSSRVEYGLEEEEDGSAAYFPASSGLR